jgi:outer membrane protein assembly factor BamB
MNRTVASLPSIIGLIALTSYAAWAADWPQWRGVNRSAKVTDFKAPEKWPEQLKQAWKVPVGEGDASPSLVGDQLYVFSREDGNEVIRALNAETGKELWADKYETMGADGGARDHAGPRASPTIVDGKVVTFGVRGMVSCLDAESGKVLWRKDEFKSWPMFYTASSPIVVDGLVIALVGGNEGSGDAGGVVAYDLASGDEKWKWAGGNPTHASPVLLLLDGSKYVLAQAGGKLAALNAAKGEVAWQIEVGGGGFGGRGRGGFGGGGFGREGRGRRGGDGEGPPRGPGGGERRGAGEQAPRSDVQGQVAQQPERGRGERGRGGRGGGGRGGRGGRGGGRDRFAATPIVDGQTIYHSGAGGALKAYQLQKEGDKISSKELWTNPTASIAFNTPVLKDGLLFGVNGQSQFYCIDAQSGKTAWTGPRDSGDGYGSVVDAGAVLLGITPDSGLVVIQPTANEYKELARIKVSDSRVFAHLIVAGNRLFVKDSDSVALFTVE